MTRTRAYDYGLFGVRPRIGAREKRGWQRRYAVHRQPPVGDTAARHVVDLRARQPGKTADFDFDIGLIFQCFRASRAWRTTRPWRCGETERRRLKQ